LILQKNDGLRVAYRLRAIARRRRLRVDERVQFCRFPEMTKAVNNLITEIAPR